MPPVSVSGELPCVCVVSDAAGSTLVEIGGFFPLRITPLVREGGQGVTSNCLLALIQYHLNVKRSFPYRITKFPDAVAETRDLSVEAY